MFDLPHSDSCPRPWDESRPLCWANAPYIGESNVAEDLTNSYMAYLNYSILLLRYSPGSAIIEERAI